MRLVNAQRDHNCMYALEDKPPFAEPGSQNARREYVQWLKIKYKTTKEASMVYPYPFASDQVDWPAIVSYMEMTKFAGWPPAWVTFKQDIQYLVQQHRRIGESDGRELVYALSKIPRPVKGETFVQLPKETLDAFT